MAKLSYKQEEAIRQSQRAFPLYRKEVTKSSFVGLFMKRGQKISFKSMAHHAQVYGSIRLYHLLGRKTWNITEDGLSRDGETHSYEFLWYLASRAGVGDVRHIGYHNYVPYSCPFCTLHGERFPHRADTGDDRWGFSVLNTTVRCPGCNSEIHLTKSYSVMSNWNKKINGE